MLNLVTGVFVEGAQRMIQDEKVTEIGKDVRKLFNLTDVDGSGDISCEEFELLIDDDNITMSNLMASLGVECHGQGRGIFKLLDADNSGQIDVKEFVSGCMRLRGNARSIDLIMLKYDFDDFDAMVTDRLSAFETMLTKVMDNLTILQRKATISNKSLQLIEHDHSQAIRMLASQMEDMAPNLAHHMADQLGALSTSPFMPHATGDLV
jgi:Ca2+-binding EF-hand superfamily protein